MEECLSAWRHAQRDDSAGAHSYDRVQPMEVATDSGFRKRLIYGLSAVTLIAVVCAASAWQFGAFNGFGRGNPAVPAAGHWEGSNPALSFDIGADGQMANVSLVLDDSPFAYCDIWAKTIPVDSNHAFAAVLGTDNRSGNLLENKVDVSGTLYGTTAYGTYRPLECGGLLGNTTQRDGTWSAQRLGP